LQAAHFERIAEWAAVLANPGTSALSEAYQ